MEGFFATGFALVVSCFLVVGFAVFFAVDLLEFVGFTAFGFGFVDAAFVAVGFALCDTAFAGPGFLFWKIELKFTSLYHYCAYLFRATG